MFESLRSRILLVVGGVALLSALSFLPLLRNSIEPALFEARNEQIKDLTQAVTLTLKAQYESYIVHRKQILERRKIELKNTIDLALANMKNHYDGYRAGIISEFTAKTSILNELRKFRYDNGSGYIWVNNANEPLPQLIMHPILPELENRILDDPKYFSALPDSDQHLFQAFNEIGQKRGAGYIEYLWPQPTADGITEERSKLSYVKLFEEWNWLVGTGVYLNDLETDAQNYLDAILAELNKSIPNISIAETGYIFIFNGEQKMLIHPSLEGVSGAGLINPATGKQILPEMMAAAHSNQATFDYPWNRPDDPKNYSYRKRAYISYFEPFDWYLATSIYIDEIEQPGRALSKKVIYLSICFILIALILSGLLSRNLTRPIRQLIQAASNIETGGLSSGHLLNKGTTEMKTLGRVIEKMIARALQEKESALQTIADSHKELAEKNQILAQEITDRREIEDALLELQNYLQAVFNSLPSILIGIDKESGVTNWNHAAVEVFGLPSRSAIGTSLHSLLPSLPWSQEEINHIISHRETREARKARNLLPNTSGYANLAIYPLITDDHEGAVVRIDDVTHQVAIEDRMIQSGKMISVGGLAAGMAHEINNPLASILQNMQVIKNRTSPQLAKNHTIAEECGTELETICRYLEKRDITSMFDAVQQSGQRAARIVANVLKFSRQEGSSIAPHSLEEIIDQTLELAQSDYHLKKDHDFHNVAIIRDAQAEVPAVPCDPTMIQQVILSILNNAVQAMTEAKEPHSPPQLTIRTLTNDDKVCLEIEDNGPGMDKQTASRIFEPFFTTKTVGQGPGLGLSISYFIITEKHGGTIDVESQPGQGSKFIINLPTS
jgi:PAS domain S-box-containing protein